MHIGRRYFPPEITLCFTKAFPSHGGLDSARYLPGEASAMLTAAGLLGNAAKATRHCPSRAVWLHDKHTGSTWHRAMLIPGLGLHSHCLEGGPQAECTQEGASNLDSTLSHMGHSEVAVRGSKASSAPRCPSYCRHILPTPRKSRGF